MLQWLQWKTKVPGFLSPLDEHNSDQWCSESMTLCSEIQKENPLRKKNPKLPFPWIIGRQRNGCLSQSQWVAVSSIMKSLWMVGVKSSCWKDEV